MPQSSPPSPTSYLCSKAGALGFGTYFTPTELHCGPPSCQLTIFSTYILIIRYTGVCCCHLHLRRPLAPTPLYSSTSVAPVALHNHVYATTTSHSVSVALVSSSFDAVGILPLIATAWRGFCGKDTVGHYSSLHCSSMNRFPAHTIGKRLGLSLNISYFFSIASLMGRFGLYPHPVNMCASWCVLFFSL